MQSRGWAVGRPHSRPLIRTVTRLPGMNPQAVTWTGPPCRCGFGTIVTLHAAGGYFRRLAGGGGHGLCVLAFAGAAVAGAAVSCAAMAGAALVLTPMPA